MWACVAYLSRPHVSARRLAPSGNSAMGPTVLTKPASTFRHGHGSFMGRLPLASKPVEDLFTKRPQALITGANVHEVLLGVLE